MKIVLHSRLQPDECEARLRQATVAPPSWFARWLGFGYRRYRRLEDAPVIGWIQDSSFELELREMYSRHNAWSGRLEPDRQHGGTCVALGITSAIWGIVAFLVIAGFMIAVLPGKKPLTGLEMSFWNTVFPPLVFGAALVLITALNMRLQRRTARVLTEFLGRVLDAEEVPG